MKKLYFAQFTTQVFFVAEETDPITIAQSAYQQEARNNQPSKPERLVEIHDKRQLSSAWLAKFPWFDDSDRTCQRFLEAGK